MTSAPEPPKLRRFFVEISQNSQTDLKNRLKHSRFPDQLAGAGWDYGSELSFMKVHQQGMTKALQAAVQRPIVDDMQGLIDYWEHSFNWPKQQEWLNNHFSHYKLM